jgi:hypothetical protein
MNRDRILTIGYFRTNQLAEGSLTNCDKAGTCATTARAGNRYWPTLQTPPVSVQSPSVPRPLNVTFMLTSLLLIVVNYLTL